MASFLAGLSAEQKADTAEVQNQATEAFPSMKNLADALVGRSGWLQNPETVDCKRIEKHLDEEANLDYEDDDEGDDGDEGDGYSTDDSDGEFDLDLDSESEFSDSDSDPGVCQDAAVQWLDALHPVIQYAVSKALWSMKFIFKGMILRDLPGLGKTLSGLLILAMKSDIGRGTCVVVAPLSCCRQWMSEIQKHLLERRFLPGPPACW
ncbi:global transactivator [Fusarium agapanthi]|uniref:Global transactivator n=1 Tax=Fusarium agapanthi TaxID=1803897 RepID=A0A9P5EA63_9HYPO|nr:global transactivator [Fusarium agapanthi]